MIQVAKREGAFRLGTAAILTLLVFGIFGIFYLESFPGAHDDAYITYTYAQNFAKGAGLVFNPGEYVWGFTSPLFTVLMGLVGLLGFDIPAVADCLGVVLYAGTAFVAYLIMARWMLPQIAMVCSAYLFCRWSSWLWNGMETHLLVFLEIGFLYCYLTEKDRLAALVAALACLTRPDALVLVLPMLLLKRSSYRYPNFLFFVVPGVVWLTFTYHYYGAILPQSFYGKAGRTDFWPYLEYTYWDVIGFQFPKTSIRWLDGMLPTIREESIATCLALCGFALIAGLQRDTRQRSANLWVVLFPAVLLLSYAWIGSIPGHEWEFFSATYFFRFLALSGIGILCSWGIRVGLNTESVVARRGAVVALGLVVSSLGAVTLIQYLETREALSFSTKKFWAGQRDRQYRRIASWINDNISDDDSLLVDEIGTFGYYTKVKIVDLNGLVTKGLEPGDRLNYEWVARKFRPDWILLPGRELQFLIDSKTIYIAVQYFSAKEFQDFTLVKRFDSPPVN